MAVVPITVKIAFVLLGLGLIIFLVGFATPYWYHREFNRQPGLSYRGGRIYIEGEEHSGLWKYCQDSTTWSARRGGSRLLVTQGCRDYLGESAPSLSDELRATQFFETVGFLAILPAILLLVLSMCIDSCKERRILPVLSAVLCIVSAGCVILGAIIFGSTDLIKDFLSWSFGITIVGGIFFGVAGVLVIIGAILKK